MSFRDIGFILKKEGSSHGITTIEDNDNKKSLHEKATQAYKLFSEGNTLIQVSIRLAEINQVLKMYMENNIYYDGDSRMCLVHLRKMIEKAWKYEFLALRRKWMN